MKPNRNQPPSRGGKRKPRRPSTCYKRILIDRLRLDGGTQTRARLDQDAVEEYAEIMIGQSNRTLPPIIVYEDTANMLWLADGFHRVSAALKNGQTEIAAEVSLGTRLDALMHSLGANQMHGVRRTNADKRRSIEVALGEETLRERSSREIAELCGVGHQLVDTVRREQKEAAPVQVDDSSTSKVLAKRVGRDGKMHPVNRTKAARSSTPQVSEPIAPKEQTPLNAAVQTRTHANDVRKEGTGAEDTDSSASDREKEHENERANAGTKIIAPLKTLVADDLIDEHIAAKASVEATVLQAAGLSTPPQTSSDTNEQAGPGVAPPDDEDPLWNATCPEWEDVQRWLSRAHDKLPLHRYTESERRAFDECFTELARGAVGMAEDICIDYKVGAHVAIHAAASLGLVLNETLTNIQ